MTLRLLAIAVVLAALSAAPATASHTVASFFTPEKAAYCKLATSLERSSWVEPELYCWTPNDGFTVQMNARGRVVKRYVAANKWWYPPRVLRRLRFGQAWWGNYNGGQGTGRGRGDVLYRCVSSANGLTCRNKANHGWWLGRFRGYRVF